MKDFKELKFEKKICSVCSSTFNEINIEGVNPRSLCDKCIRKYLKMSKKKGG